MIAPAKTSTDHEELHRKVHRIQGEVWEGYVTLPQRKSERQSTGDRLRRQQPADDMVAVRKAFFVTFTVNSFNVRISDVAHESLDSLLGVAAQWKQHLTSATSVKSDMFLELSQAFTEASEMASLGENVRILFDRPDRLVWNDAKNDRRCDLIDKEIEGTLLAVEKRELETLQRQMLAYRRKVAPLPLKEVRELHKHFRKLSEFE